MISLLRTPVRLALAALCVHLTWIVTYFGVGHEVRDFIKIGPRFITSSDASSVIRYDRHYAYPANHDQGTRGLGYDGEFSYFIALDPSKAHYYIRGDDDASYRYQRILYPVAARFTALEQRSAVPWTMLTINWLSVGVGTLALAAWLRRRGAPPQLAALYALYPGLLLAVQRDLTEPLAYALVACGIYLFDFGGPRGVLWAGLSFGAAALTRETTLAFAVLFSLSIIAGRPNARGPQGRRMRVAQFAGFAILAFVPVAVWTAALWTWLGMPDTADMLTGIPFGGIFQTPLRLTRQPVAFVFVALPTLILVFLALRGLRVGPGRLERLCLVVNAALIVVFSSGNVWASYTAIGRAVVAVILAGVLCLPYLRGNLPGFQGALPLAWALLMILLPVIAAYGFSTVKLQGTTGSPPPPGITRVRPRAAAAAARTRSIATRGAHARRQMRSDEGAVLSSPSHRQVAPLVESPLPDDRRGQGRGALRRLRTLKEVGQGASTSPAKAGRRRRRWPRSPSRVAPRGNAEIV